MNAEFPSSFELWEFVTSFEEGSLPASAWDERALAVIAVWYLSLLPAAEATRRIVIGLKRNQIRFAGRPGALGEDFAPEDVWPCVMRQVLAVSGKTDPVAVANRLMQPSVVELRNRAA